MAGSNGKTVLERHASSDLWERLCAWEHDAAISLKLPIRLELSSHLLSASVLFEQASSNLFTVSEP